MERSSKRMHVLSSASRDNSRRDRHQRTFRVDDEILAIFSRSSSSRLSTPRMHGVLDKQFDSLTVETNHRIDNVVFRLLASKNPSSKGYSIQSYIDKNEFKESSGIPAQDDLIQLLTARLATSKNYRIEPAFKSRNRFYPEVSANELIREEQLLNSIVLSKSSDSDLLQLSSTKKSQSLALQKYIKICSQQEVEMVCSALSYTSIVQLITHQFGNYTIQELVRRSMSFQKRVEEHCQEDFYSLADQEYSSRVMQLLIEASNSFRSFALKACEHNLDRVVEKISSVFLIAACIRTAKCEDEYRFLLNELSMNIKPWLTKKYFKRILVSILQCCEQPTLQQVYKLLGLQTNILKFFEDKYSTYVVLTFAERGHQPSIDLLAQIIRHDHVALLEAEYFRFFISKLSKDKGGSILKELFGVLSNKQSLELILTRVRREKGCYFAYLLALTAEAKQYESLTSFWKGVVARVAS